MKKIISQRPIVIVANSSFYIYHYRKLLLENLIKKNHVITISPIDKSTEKLSRLSIHLPLRINRKNDLNIFSFIISFFRLLFLIRAIKPKLVHGHTLKTNLLVSIITSLYSIPSVLSFTGLGKLSTSRKYNLMFNLILKTISFFSTREFIGFLKIKKNINRSKYIFQNKNDKLYFESINNHKNIKLSEVIYGSGIPKQYLSINNNKNYKLTSSNDMKLPKFEFIFCARLLISKGIKTFLELSKEFPSHNFIVFGERDISSKDSITQESLNKFSKRKNVFIKGYKKDPLLNLTSKNPVLIVPSSYGEGLPRAILEGFALRIPVICSKSATCDLFTEQNLYISQGNKMEDYKLCIEQLFIDFRNGNLSKKLNFSQNMSKNYSEDKIVKKTLLVYKQLLDFKTIPNIFKKNLKKSFNLHP